MMFLLCVIILLGSSSSIVEHVSGQDIFDPRVFNWNFYLTNNADLVAAGIVDPQGAQQHWQNNGLGEGRQALSTFHTLQYLSMYPDVKNAYGTDYRSVLAHYLTHGISEGRQGWVRTYPGGAYGRYTFGNGLIWMSASTRVAGAIDSLYYAGLEFINAWDHGRELQYAITTGNGECYNPTEAGSNRDGTGASTSSNLQAIWVNNTVKASQVLPAFWLQPGETDAAPNPICTTAINTEIVSNFQLNTQVIVGFKLPRVIQFIVDIRIPSNLPFIQVEGPTAYLSNAFNTFFTYDFKTLNQITPNNNAPEGQIPVIIATSDHNFAMGVWSPKIPSPGYPNAGYGLWNFPGNPPLASTCKWSVVYRLGPFSAGSVLRLETYGFVGSLDDVVSSMQQFVQSYK